MINLINSRILLSIASITAAGALIIGATFAFFSDSGTSSGNVFATGTLDLKLSDSDQAVQDNVTASFGGTLAPNDCTASQTLNLRNSGTTNASHAEITAANVVTDGAPAASPDIDTFLRIQTLTYDGGDVLGQIPDQGADGNAFVDLADWQASAGLDNLALADLNTDHPLVMVVCLDSSAGNDLQGDSDTVTFTVTLNQDASQ